MSDGQTLTIPNPFPRTEEPFIAAVRLERWRRRAQRRWCDATHPERGGSCVRGEGHRGPHRTAGEIREWRG